MLNLLNEPILSFIEQPFEIMFKEDELLIDNFGTVHKIIERIREKSSDQS